MANPFHGSGPLRSREGLTSRPAAASDDIQLQIDPIHADLDDHITGLRGKIRQLKGGICGANFHEIISKKKKKLEALSCTARLLSTNRFQVAQEIENEAKFQKDFISQLQMTLIKAQAGVKNNVRRINKKIIQQGSNHVLHVVLFALFCFFLIYLWSKFSKR